MSVTSGFFNSLNHDRRYNAQQMSAIFDGVINDGIFANIGVAFKVSADTGVTINIGEGKAWFTSAWVYNDALLPITLEGSEVVLDRIDAVVIDVDHNESVRSGSIRVVKGTPSSSPKRPTMISEKKHSQHPLAYIYRKAGSTNITQADITNMVGTSSCPYITGILQVQNIDNIVAQWEGQWNQWYAEKIAETDSDSAELLAEMKSEFEIWFNDIQTLLDDDAATALAAQVAELQGKFDDLAKNRCVYDAIEDSDLDVILGSDGTPIEGKTVFGEGTGNSEGTYISGPLDMKGFPIKGLNNPTDNDEATNKQYVDSAILEQFGRVSNPNLLDNWYFGNPVNQREKTSYSSVKYGIDRWYSYAGAASVEIVSGGVKVTAASTGSRNYFTQRLPEDMARSLLGKVITLSVLINNVLFTKTAICPTSFGTGTQSVIVLPVTPSGNVLNLTIASTKVDVEFSFLAGTNFTLQAIKLELGSVQTLAHQDANGNWVLNEIPNYAEQLARCQRYFVRLKGFSSYAYFGSGLATSATLARMVLPLPVPMRITPTLTHTGRSVIMVNGTQHTYTGPSEVGLVGTELLIQVASTGMEAGQPASFFLDASEIFELSADL